jgi:hypothetical protein
MSMEKQEQGGPKNDDRGLLVGTVRGRVKGIKCLKKVPRLRDLTNYFFFICILGFLAFSLDVI